LSFETLPKLSFHFVKIITIKRDASENYSVLMGDLDNVLVVPINRTPSPGIDEFKLFAHYFTEQSRH
jgi:hypothetical protein